MTQAVAAQNTALKRAGVAIAEIKEIGGLELSADTIDVTTLASTAGYKEFIAGLKDAGEVSISGNFYPGDSTGQAQMFTDFEAGTVQAYTIEFPSAMSASWGFSGIVTGFKSGATSGDAVSFEATLKVTGQPTLNITNSTGLTTPFLTVSGSTSFVPAAANGVYEYVVTVATATASVTVTPTATAGVITVNGNVVATGVASSAIPLGAAGSVTTITVQVKEVGKVAKTYTIKVQRP